MKLFAEKKAAPASRWCSPRSVEGTILFGQPKKARAIADVFPGQNGSVCCEGVFWKARCNADVAIASGEMVLVIGRHTETLTLLVVPAR